MIVATDTFKNALSQNIREQTQIRISHFMLDNPMLRNNVSLSQPEDIEVMFASAEAITSSIRSPSIFHFAYMAKDTMRMDGTQIMLNETEFNTWENGWIPNYYSDNTFSESLNGYDYADGGLLQTFTKTYSYQIWSPTGFFIEFDNMLNVYATKINVEIIKDTITVYNETLDNDSRIFSFKNDYIDIDTINITFLSLNKPQTYMRVIWFDFGVAKIYLNQDLMQKAFAYEKEVDIMSREMSYTNFSFNVKNYPIIYDGDTTLGDYANFKDYQPLTFEIGITNSNNVIEWVQVARLYTFGKIIIKENYFIVTAKDPLSIYNSVHPKFTKFDEYPQNISWRNIALQAFYDVENAFFTRLIYQLSAPKKMSDYVGHPSIKRDLYYNANETLQLIANYNNCVVFIGNDANIIFKDAILAKPTISNNGGELLIIPDNNDPTTLFSFESDLVSDESGQFATNPLIEITYSIPNDIYLLDIRFDAASHIYAIDFTVTYYDDEDTIIEEITATDNTEDIYQEAIEVYNVKKIAIEISKWSKPLANPVITKYINGLMSNCYLEAKDMFNYPSIETFDKPSIITHKYYDYPLVDEWIDLGTMDAYELYYEAIRAYITLDGFYTEFYYTVESGTPGTITTMNTWANTYGVGSNDTDLPITFRVYGKQRSSVEYRAKKEYSEGGVKYQLDNPYVITEGKALEQIDWYYNYINSGFKLNIKHRGDPTIDVMDYILIDTKSRKRVPVVVTKVKLDYNAGLRGELEAVKV